VDPETGFNYDDTKRYIDAAKGLGKEDKEKIFSGNARRVYQRLAKRIASAVR
jgi:4-oxalmesaconate hydratase